LARGNATAAEIEQAVRELIDTVKYHPIPLGSFMLDYNVLKGMIVQSMYGTFYWPLLTSLLDMLLTGNTKDALAVLTELAGGASVTEESKQLLMGVMGIHCADRTVRVSTFDEFLPVVDQLYKGSKIFGDVTPAISMICAQWKMKAKEVYDGDFQANTKEPVLLIGNTGDGFTPLASAYNVSSGFKDSVVLEVNGYGVSIRSPNTMSTVWRKVTC
jgi:TAP-like protein